MRCTQRVVRRSLIGWALGVIALSGQAQSYPVKPVRLVIPFAAGGGTDLVARAIAQRLSESIGQPVIAENRAGAGGVIGAEHVAKAAPDGYTLLLGSPGPLTINPNLRSKVPYEALKDFAPITLATISPFVLVVHPSVPAKSVKDLIAIARATPGRLNYGSAGQGSVSHLAAEQLKALANIDLVNVPYKGSNPALTDLLSGQLDLMIENQPVVLPHIGSGRVRGLAVGTASRSGLLPRLPTMREAGVADYETSTAFGVLAPARTPQAIVLRLYGDISAALKSAELKDRLAKQGLEAVGSTPERYAAHMRDESARYARLIKLAGIRVE
ncbi:MAG: tripartite tricarboxylate transporter substrate binding protein [Burkholderiales bacterium]|nr:tripartite tricarboxylate transporter substrate binding protein [Burkholderiales bacterium]